MKRALLLLLLAGLPVTGGCEAPDRSPPAPVDPRSSVAAEEPSPPSGPRTWREEFADLRSALHGPDDGAAGAAADELGPWLLDLDGLGRISSLAAARPVHVLRGPKDGYCFADAGTRGLGPDGVVDLLSAAADLGPEAVLDRQALEELHRALLPEQVPVLAALLRRCGHPVLGGRLLWMIGLLADTSPRNADVVAETWLFARAAYGTDDAGRSELLRDASLAVDLSGDGVPAAMRTLARAAWLPPEDEASRNGALRVPGTWLARTLAGRRATEGDLPWLAELVHDSLDWEARETALRLAATAPGDGATALLDEAAREEGAPGVLAAALLDRRLGGHRLRERMTDSADDDAMSAVLAWEFAPAEAAERLLRRLRAITERGPGSPEWSTQDPFRDAATVRRGVSPTLTALPPDGLRVLRAGIVAPDIHPALALACFAAVDPEGLDASTAAALARRLAGQPAGEEADEVEGLALLEAAAPEALDGLLRTWTAGSSGRTRDRLLALRARLGHYDAVDAMLQSWPRWWDRDVTALARVRDPRVEAFLVERLERGMDGEGRTTAALAAWRGLPERSAAAFIRGREEDDGTLAAMVLAGELREAFRRRALGDGVPAESIAALGTDPDPRSRALLEEFRDDAALGLRWPAVAGLALAGDAAARREFLALLDEPRPWLFDTLRDGFLLSLDGDPEARPRWIRLVGAQCCLSFFAEQALRFGTCPFVPWERGGTAEPCDARARVEAWFREVGPRLVRSRLLDAWVVGPAR